MLGSITGKLHLRQAYTPKGTTLKMGTHNVCVFAPKISTVYGILTQENLIIRDRADPNCFNHFIAHIYHPQHQDPSLPALILLPGMLCNGNLFRITHDGKNFKSLDASSSLTNQLAFQGYSVFVVHPRYARWIYHRYVDNKLGINNKYSANIGFDQGIIDLKLYLNACLEISKARSAAIVGFSMGSMQLANYLAFEDLDPRLMASILLSAPVEFKENTEPLIAFLRYYGILSKYIPLMALSTTAKMIIPLKDLLRFATEHGSKEIAQKIITEFPVIGQIFDLENSDPGTITAILYYVLEPLTKRIVNDLLSFTVNGQLNNLTTGQDTLARLEKRSLPPSLIINGTRDAIAPKSNALLLGKALKAKPVLLNGAGHVDLVTSISLMEVANRITDFITTSG